MSAPPLGRPAHAQRLRCGDRIGAELIVRRVVGTGATSTVYEARREHAGDAVAVKVVHGLAAQPRHLERFCKEARTCARLHTVHVPRILEVGQLDDGSPYLAMELLDGEPLEAVLARGPLPIAATIGVGRQLLCALEEVHRRRVLHRDVKPDNVVLTSDGDGALVVKLVDFGISCPLDGAGATTDGMVVGTPRYMAPEQVRGDPLDERADLYAAGAVMYEMLTGYPPHRGTSTRQLMAAVLHDPIVPPTVARPRCPRPLEELVMRMLRRAPRDRPASAHAARTALEQLGAQDTEAAQALLRPDGGELPSRFPEGG